MSKLILFGCSYTAEFHFDEGFVQPFTDYYKFRGGNFPMTWGQVLAKKLNLELVNYGKGGNGNDQIFQDVCKHSSEFGPDDVVIIGWSYMARFRWAHFLGNHWEKMGPHYLTCENINEKTHNDIIHNRTHQLYVEQIYDFEKIIESLSKSVGFKLYFWSADYQIIYPNESINKKYKYLGNKYIKEGETIFDEVFRRNGQRILEETNGLIRDLHFGESGHLILGEIFYSHISNKLI